MDKVQYKELLSDAVSENTYNQKIVEKVQNLVEDYPNNMQLGKKVRELYWSLNDDRDISNQLNLFED
tara:strand:- start:268 stop:468 length:201 start_codon:yes stop_codon:yes gene_type:complete